MPHIKPQYDFEEINRRARTEPEAFVAECDLRFDGQAERAAERIAAGLRETPLVLLSGPSGSGKTTTAKLLQLKLAARGVRTHVVSLDNYYRDVDLDTHPRDDTGGVDFESPELLDIPLLTEHFRALAAGLEVAVPKFDFARQARSPGRGVPLRLGDDEAAIFEGIHALNPVISGPIGHKALGLYVSARANVVREGALYFKGTWARLLRRLIRDEKFRAAPAAYTMTLWANVRRGEKRFISPYKDSADIAIDSFFPYELCALRPFTLALVREVPALCPRREELSCLYGRLESFAALDESYIAHDALLREFIGGGSIHY